MMPMPRCSRLVKRQAGRADDLHVLQVALRPAPVADGDVDSEGGDSSQEPPQSVAMRTFQPPRRISAASTKSCDSTWPPKGLRPSSSRQPAALGERRARG